MNDAKLRLSGTFAVVALICGVHLASAESGVHLLLDKMRMAESRTSYEGTKTTRVNCSSQPVEAVSKVVHLKPDFTRTEYLSPKRLVGTIIIRRGSEIWKYSQSESVWDQLCGEAAGGVDEHKELLRNYVVSIVGEENVASHAAYVLEAIPKSPADLRRKIWVDKQFFLIVKTEVDTPNGHLVDMSVYKDLHVNPPKISRSLFSINGRLRCKVVRRVDFAVVKPSYLPAGYRLAESKAVSQRGRSCSHLRYSNGASSISLFQRPLTPNEGHPAKESTMSDSSIAWCSNGMLFTLVGEIRIGDLKKIAHSVGK